MGRMIRIEPSEPDGFRCPFDSSHPPHPIPNAAELEWHTFGVRDTGPNDSWSSRRNNIHAPLTRAMMAVRKWDLAKS